MDGEEPLSPNSNPHNQNQNQLITTTQQLLTSLIQTHIPLIHHFKPKWSLIHLKLTHLQTLLSSLPTPSHPLSSTLLSSLSFTLSSAVTLAGKCSDPRHLPSGKLLTQNHIDSLSSTLDRNIKDCQILINSGILNLHEGVARLKNLLVQVQIGSVESKYSAIDSLLTLLNEDDKNVIIAVAQGIVPILTRSLDSTMPEMKEKAVAVIARVSSVESCKHALVDEGLVLLSTLIRVVECGSVLGKEKACKALQGLSFSRENARAIGCRGGISSLLEVCHGGAPSSQAMAAGVLRNLAKFEEIKENFIEENAIQVLVTLLGSGTTLARENSVGCLSNLILDDNILKVLVAREGGVEMLRNYWDSTPIDKGLELAIELVNNLSSYHPIGEVLIDQGFTSRLLPLLNCGVLALRIGAANAVYELGFSSKARKEMGELGCVSSLVRMLDGKAIEEREAGAKALSILLQCSCNKKLFKREERGIMGTVELLDPLTNKLDKKWPVLVLASLVQSKKCRKQMVGAGACVYLQKLIQSDVEGAKKLFKSLGRSKLWGVFVRPS